MTVAESARSGPLLAHSRRGIVIALDLPTMSEAERIVSETTEVDGVVGYKIGPVAVLDLGLGEVVRRLRKLTDHALVYDHQKAGLDIGSNADNYAEALARAQVDAAILFPLAGPAAASSFLHALAARSIPALVGGELPVPDYRISVGGWIADTALAQIVALALDRGHRDLIVPAGPRLAEFAGSVSDRELAAVRLFVPGIGRAGSGLESVRGLVNKAAGVFPIVGRAVIAADDPGREAQRIAERLDGLADDEAER